MSARQEKGSAMAELRARRALQAAGLDPSVAVERASSVTNEVWLTATHAVRVNRRYDRRLARERIVAAALPPAVGYPAIVACGGGPGDDWLVSERVPGVPLAHQWPRLGRDDRRRAVRQLAQRLAVLHDTVTPTGLPPIEGAPQLLEVGAADPSRALVDALRSAMRLDHVDHMLLHSAIEMVEANAPALAPFAATTLIHGDVTFENVLWHDGEVTALLDVEWGRPGPRDLDLDILLRCCAYPQLHVAEAFAAATHPADYAEVPHWLAEDHPGLFDYPRLRERLRVYAIAYEVRALLAAPPVTRVRDLPPLHPYNRLALVVRRDSHLDHLAIDWP